MYGTTIRPVPPGGHEKNSIESWHRTISSIFLQLQCSSISSCNSILAIRATQISNDLYMSDVMSAYETAKGLTCPHASGGKPIFVGAEILIDLQEPIVRRKLTRILRSHSLKPSNFKLGDLTQIYVHHNNQKRDKWLSPRQIFSIEIDVGTVAVPGLFGNTINAVFENVRAAFPISNIAEYVISIIDELDDNLYFEMSKELDNSSYLLKPGNCSAAALEEETDYSSSEIIACSNWRAAFKTNIFNGHQPKNAHSSQRDDNVTTGLEEKTTVIKSNAPTNKPSNLWATGVHVQIYWLLAGQFYSGQVIEEHDEGTRVIV